MKKLFTALLLTATMFALNASVTFAPDIGKDAKIVPKTTEAIYKVELNAKTYTVAMPVAQKIEAKAVMRIYISPFNSAPMEREGGKAMITARSETILYFPRKVYRQSQNLYRNHKTDNYNSAKTENVRWLILSSKRC